MIPKYRAWDSYHEKVVKVLSIDFEDKVAYVEQANGDRYDIHFDNLKFMQSTGLKDKNGVEIFEGYIIGSENKDSETWYVSHHKVVWHDTGFKGKQLCSSSFIGLAHWTRGEKGYVVIGNIYENPELMEGKK
ncbi:YopX family protein [Enterococcus avium]|uniref:YopX family protein n=1 Tax=Enterococcus avium TaxID=33945 RepID=UPI003462A205